MFDSAVRTLHDIQLDVTYLSVYLGSKFDYVMQMMR